MRILNISAQKPDATGSGVYLAEMLRCELSAGHAAAVVAGCDAGDEFALPEGAVFNPVRFNTPELPFHVCGMSDVMPYAATRYRDLTPEQTEAFRAAFAQRIAQTAEQFAPDVVICHHLYLVCAVARETLPNVPMAAICHSTDMRQMRSHGLERERIVAAVRKLDVIFALHDEQATEIVELYGVDPARVHVLGTGYNAQVFSPGAPSSGNAGRVLAKGFAPTPQENADFVLANAAGRAKGEQGEQGEDASYSRVASYSEHENGTSTHSSGEPVRFVYVGKIGYKKGVESLVAATDMLAQRPDAPKTQFNLIGGHSDAAEYERIQAAAGACHAEVNLLGKVSQERLVRAYRESDVFVLPSFFEGLPLVIIEALACGCRVVATDLPGVRPWLAAHVPEAPIHFVEPPAMQSVDEPVPAELPAFEARLADALLAAAREGRPEQPCDTSALSWEALVQRACALLSDAVK